MSETNYEQRIECPDDVPAPYVPPYSAADMEPLTDAERAEREAGLTKAYKQVIATYATDFMRRRQAE